MSPLLPAAVLTGLFLLGWRGFAMARDPGPAARVLVEEGLVVVEERGPSPMGRLVRVLTDRLAPRTLRLLGPRRIERIRDRLDAAGRPHGWTLETYAGRKGIYTVLFGTVGILLILQGQALVGIPLLVAGWYWMDIALRAEASRRQQTIERDLPDFLDILAVSVHAGLGFRSGMERVAGALPGPLADEIMTTLRKLDVGATRRAAFGELRRRNPSESLNQFVSALLQAEELGTPLSTTLSSIADEMRRDSAQRARRRAARAAPRVSLVVTTLMVPGALLIIGAALILSADVNLGDLLG